MLNKVIICLSALSCLTATTTALPGSHDENTFSSHHRIDKRLRIVEGLKPQGVVNLNDPSPASTHPLPVENSKASCTVDSYESAATIGECQEVTINSFQVPKGKTLNLTFADGATVNVIGEVQFECGGPWLDTLAPLVNLKGSNIHFNGNNHPWKGHGECYWDGQGTNGGAIKPRSFFKIEASGEINDVFILNQPAHGFNISTTAPLLINGARVDVSAAAKPNSKSGTEAAGHNTDGFGILFASNLTIKNSIVVNQDDCIAINQGENIVFENNTCDGGHGISVGSVKTGRSVKNVLFKNNIVTNSDNGLRIKTYVGAKDGSVENIRYEGNQLINITKVGIDIQQDYDNGSPTGKPSNTMPIHGVVFDEQHPTTVAMNAANAKFPIYILCGDGSCADFDFAGVEIKNDGGKTASISGITVKNYKEGEAGVGAVPAKPVKAAKAPKKVKPSKAVRSPKKAKKVSLRREIL